MAKSRRGRNAFLIAVVAVGVVACGGGGSGGSSTPPPGGANATPPPSGGGSNPPSNGFVVPMNPPGAPAIIYAGSTSPATLNDTTVGALGDALYFAVMYSLGLADDSQSIPLPSSGVIDVSESGPAGGTMHVFGRVEADGTGWLQYDLTEFGADGFTWNGTQVFERSAINNGQQDAVTTIKMIDFSLQSAGRNVTINGALTRRASPAPVVTTITGTISLEDPGAGFGVLASNVEIVREPIADGFTIRGTGQVFDARHGMVEMSFEKPWAFATGEYFPRFGGPIMGTVASGARLRIVSLTPEIASAEFTSSGMPVFDRSARVVWPTLFESQIAPPSVGVPEADAGASLHTAPGTTVSLNGAFSAHSDGSFLSYLWTLKFRPPGSTAVLDSANSVRPNITVDKAGRYLVELRASDGMQTTTDYVVLTGDDGIGTVQDRIETQLAPAASGRLGDLVAIDKTRTTALAINDTASFDVEIISPSGDSVGISQDASSLTFMATERGVYQAILVGGSPSFPQDYQPIEIETTRLFAPVVSFPVGTGFRFLHVAAADLNDDGLDDLVTSHEIQGGNKWLEIHFATNDPSFSLPVVLEGSEGGAVAIGDVTADGRPDIVAPLANGIAIFEQVDGETFATPFALPGVCEFASTSRPIVIVDVDNDGLNDIVAQGSCRDTIEVYRQTAAGVFEPAVSLPLGQSDTDLQLASGDLNGDTNVDIAFSFDGFVGGNGFVGILYGNGDGSFLSATHLPYEAENSTTPALGIVDIDNDGRDDLIFALNEDSLPNARVIRILLQASDGTLIEQPGLPVAKDILYLKFQDFNDDGLLDIAQSALDYNLLVNYQKSDHTFAETLRMATELGQAVRVPPEAMGDFNGDGVVDIAFGMPSSRESAIAVLFGLAQ